jgi:hypothetical protein
VTTIPTATAKATLNTTKDKAGTPPNQARNNASPATGPTVKKVNAAIRNAFGTSPR